MKEEQSRLGALKKCNKCPVYLMVYQSSSLAQISTWNNQLGKFYIFTKHYPFQRTVAYHILLITLAIPEITTTSTNWPTKKGKLTSEIYNRLISTICQKNSMP